MKFFTLFVSLECLLCFNNGSIASVISDYPVGSGQVVRELSDNFELPEYNISAPTCSANNTASAAGVTIKCDYEVTIPSQLNKTSIVTTILGSPDCSDNTTVFGVVELSSQLTDGNKDNYEVVIQVMPDDKEAGRKLTSCPESTIKVKVFTEFGGQISWTLKNKCTGVAFFLQTEDHAGDNTLYPFEECVPSAAYEFTIDDTRYGCLGCDDIEPGWYEVMYNGEVVKYGEDFGSSETTSFGSCEDGSDDPSDSSSDDLTSCPESTIDVKVFTDYGGETSWTLHNKCSGEEFFLGTEKHADDSTLYPFEECVPSAAYEFTINDSWGDGLCCDCGPGWYKVTYNGEVEKYGEDFGYSETTSFGSCEDGSDDPSDSSSDVQFCLHTKVMDNETNVMKYHKQLVGISIDYTAKFQLNITSTPFSGFNKTAAELGTGNFEVTVFRCNTGMVKMVDAAPLSIDDALYVCIKSETVDIVVKKITQFTFWKSGVSVYSAIVGGADDINTFQKDKGKTIVQVGTRPRASLFDNEEKIIIEGTAELGYKGSNRYLARFTQEVNNDASTSGNFEMEVEVIKANSAATNIFLTLYGKMIGIFVTVFFFF